MGAVTRKATKSDTQFIASYIALNPDYDDETLFNDAALIALEGKRDGKKTTFIEYTDMVKPINLWPHKASKKIVFGSGRLLFRSHSIIIVLYSFCSQFSRDDFVWYTNKTKHINNSICRDMSKRQNALRIIRPFSCERKWFVSTLDNIFAIR